MKKEMDKINIIKFSKIFVLSCFSFLTFFSFSEAQIFPTPPFDIEDAEYFTIDPTNPQPIYLNTYPGFSDSASTKVHTIFRGEYPDITDIIQNGGNTSVTWTATAGWNPTSIYAGLYFCPTTDNYWALLQDSNGGNLYTTYHCTATGGGAGIITPGSEPDNNTSTRIILINPVNHATTSSTTIELEVQYYINSTTNPDLENLTVEFYLYNSLLMSGTQAIPVTIENIIYDELITATTSISLVNNQNYSWNAKLNAGFSDPTCSQGIVAITFCLFNNSLNRFIATSGTQRFTIGDNPLDSIQNFGNSIFDASGQDSNLLGGGCAFVATSTCAITDPTSYGGCFTNSLIVVLCPSINTIHYATSTLMNSFYNKMPFGFFIQPYVKISELVNSTTTALGQDVTVNIDVLGNGTTTIFSWNEAKNFMDNSIGEGVINTLMIIELVGLTFYAFYRLIGLGKSNDSLK